MATKGKTLADPVEEFIDSAVRTIGEHHCHGAIHDEATYQFTYARGAHVDLPAKTLVLPNLAHFKHGPLSLEHAKRVRELDRVFRGQYREQIAAFVADEESPRIAGASRQYFDELLAPVMTADQSAVTGTAETALWPVSPWSATVANQLQPGQVYKISAIGVLTSAASSPGTLTLTPRWGSTTSGTSFGISAASATLTVSKTNVPWFMEMFLTCRTTGSSGTAVMVGEFACDQAGVSSLAFGGPSTTIDTTTAQGVFIGVTLGSASDSMTTRLVTVEALN